MSRLGVMDYSDYAKNREKMKVAEEGLETPPNLPGKTANATVPGAESGALAANNTSSIAQSISSADSDLVRLAALWPSLPIVTRSAILALVDDRVGTRPRSSGAS